MATTSSRAAILLGATGAVGKRLLPELLASTQYDQVHAFVRRPFKASTPHLKDEAKLVEHVINFDQLLEANNDQGQALADVKAEAVYITLGTTRAQAGSAAEFERVDRHLVLAAAKAAKTDAAKQQRLLYCSSGGSNARSPFLYMKSKGLTEHGLVELGYADTIIFRPGYLAQPDRPHTRLVETLYGAFSTHVLARLSDGVEIPCSVLAKAMRVAGERGSTGLTSAGTGSPPDDRFPQTKSGPVTIISNVEAKRLAREASK